MNIALTGAAFFSVLCIVTMLALILGAYIGREIPGKWKFCTDELPLNNGRVITNYPVAFFDDEFGVVVDQAEYHPNRAVKWFTVSEGAPCYPFAWYDLPSAPWPRQTLYKAYSGNRQPNI